MNFLIRRCLHQSRFPMRFTRCLRRGRLGWGRVMLLRREKQMFLSLRDRIALATQVMPELCSAVAEAVGVRARDSARVRRLVEAEAWTDAALALSDAVLPH
jgi:hypothetical protein